jgi:hypothetical protein
MYILDSDFNLKLMQMMHELKNVVKALTRRLGLVIKVRNVRNPTRRFVNPVNRDGGVS